MDKLMVGFIVFMVIFLIFVTYDIANTNDRARAQAQAIGCTYIGSARDMKLIGFFECGNEIVLKRIK